MMIDNQASLTNTIVYQGRLHWVLFLGPMLLFLSMLILPYYVTPLREMANLIALVALLWGGMMALRYAYSSLVIKKKQVILCTGVLVRQTIDIPLAKIESIDIRQSIIGSLLQYGTLVITGTGGTRQYVEYLNRPLTCRRYIEQLMHE